METSDQALVDWWSERVPALEERVKAAEGDESSKDTAFYWGHLVWQELVMWRKIGEPVTHDDLAFIVNRRGFNHPQRQFLIEGLTFLSLWAEREVQ